MTAHTCERPTPGCYRCELAADEVRYSGTRWSSHDIMDAGAAIGLNHHDIAILVTALEEADDAPSFLIIRPSGP